MTLTCDREAQASGDGRFDRDGSLGRVQIVSSDLRPVDGHRAIPHSRPKCWIVMEPQLNDESAFSLADA